MLNERKLTERELDKRAEAIQGLLSNKRTLVKKYGKDAEKVMYGIATKQAKSKVESMNKDKIKELIQLALQKEDASTIDTGFSGRADYGEEDKALGQEDELEMKGLEEGHGLSQKDIDVLDLLVRAGEDDYLSDDEVEILKFIIKSNILQDKRKDLSVKEDLDVGHQDNEPHMLKAELARAGKMIQMLYKAIDKYDGQGEVDFPQWWQAKIIKANAMLDSAFDYLDGEENVAKIDAMIDAVDINEGVDKKYSDFLLALRDSGVTNMFGASPYLQKEFGLDKREAREILSNWMQSFNEGIDYDEALTLRGMLADLKKEREQLFRDMEQEAEPEGGPIADRYGDELNKLEDRLYKINKQLRDYDMNESTRQDLGMVSSISKSRAKAHLKNPSNDGSKVYGLDGDGKRVELKDLNDVDKFKKFEIDADLNEELSPEDHLQIVRAMLVKAEKDGDDDLKRRALADMETVKKAYNLKESAVNEVKDIDKLILKMEPGSTIKIDGKIRTKDKYGNWRHEDDENDILVNRDIVKIANNKNMKVFKSGNFHIIESVNEAMDGGQLFDYFANKGYVVKERRPDGYPPKEGVEGYIVKDSEDSGKRRSNPGQMVIFQYNKDTDQFTISQLGGYSIDQKEAYKAGMREEGGSSVAGMDYYITDGNYTPVNISAEGLKDIVDHVMGGLSREAKRQRDFYADRGPTSGTIDELKAKIASAVKEVVDNRKKKEFKVGDKVTYLGHPGEITKVNKEMTGATTYNVSYDKGTGKTKASNIYNKGGEIKALEEKLTKKSSVEKHIEDFKDSDAPQFKGKSLKKIKQMALASFLSKQGKKKVAEGEEKLQMTYKDDPVNLQISKFGGTSEKPNETVLFIAVGGKGKRGSKGSKSALERRLKLLDQKVDKILFTNNDNITKEIKSFSKNDFKIK